MAYQLIIEGNNYYGSLSEERCAAIETYLTRKLRVDNIANNIKMKEYEISPNLVKPLIIVRYNHSRHNKLLNEIDGLLIQIGIVSVSAVVSKIVTHAPEGAILGGLAGSMSTTGSSSKDQGKSLLSMVVFVLLGGALGSLIEKEGLLQFVATKESGKWIYHEVNKLYRQ